MTAVTSVTPTTIAAGASTLVAGRGFRHNHGVTISLDGVGLVPARTDAFGAFSKRVTLPASTPAGQHVIGANDGLRLVKATLVVTNAPGDTFRDDFSGGLDSSRWRSTFHVPDSLVKIFDQVRVVNGMLELDVARMADGTWHGGLIDTTTFRQLYGRFGVRAKVTQGRGLFGAPLWMYAKGVGWENELDVCEILAGPPGTNPKGYKPYPYADVTLAHFHCIKNASRPGYRYHLPAGTFADALHEFEIEWRKDHVAWFVDGTERARVIDPTLIPDHAMPLILDHAIGGSWAGPPDATTPDRATIWVDEVWAKA